MGMRDRISRAQDSELRWQVSVFPNVMTSEPVTREWTWGDICSEMTPETPPSAPNAEKETKQNGRTFSGAVFRPGANQKTKELALHVSMLVFDFDSTVPFSVAIEPFKGHRWCAYASFSNTAQKHEQRRLNHRFRIIVPLATPVPAAKYEPVGRAAWWYLSRGLADPALMNSVQCWLTPRQPPGRVWWSDRSAPDAPVMDWSELEEQGKALPIQEALTEVSKLTLERGTLRLLQRLQRVSDGAGWSWPGCSVSDDDGDANEARWDSPIRPGPPRQWSKSMKIMRHFRPDAVFLLIGPTKAGKTAWVLNVAEGAAASQPPTRDPWPVLYVSAELGTDEVVARLIAQRSERVWWSSIVNGKVSPTTIEDAANDLCASIPNFYAWAPPHNKRNADALELMVQKVSAVHGGAPVMVVLDYLQRFGDPGESGDMRLSVREVSGRIRDLCRSRDAAPKGDWWPKGVPWPGAAALVVSSTGRKSYDLFTDVEKTRGAPLDDLLAAGKESGELEYDAVVIAALATNPDDEIGTVKRKGIVRIARARMTQGGRSVGYLFDGARGRWDEETPPTKPRLGVRS